MKNLREYKIQILCLLGITLLLLFQMCLTVLVCNPNTVFCVIFGSVYRKAGETVITTEGGKTETLAIYKAKNKPFLIVGPCRFHCHDEKYGTKDEWEDFFFVNPNQVIRTCTDKGGDVWFRLPWLLFIMDDLTVRDRVRAPYWDDLEHEGASVRYDEATASYVYRLWINEPKQSVSFAIPARFFTEDLLRAPQPAWD